MSEEKKGGVRASIESECESSSKEKVSDIDIGGVEYDYSNREFKRKCDYEKVCEDIGVIGADIDTDQELTDKKLSPLTNDNKTNHDNNNSENDNKSQVKQVNSEEYLLRITLREGELCLPRQCFAAVEENKSSLLHTKLSSGGFMVDMKLSDFHLLYEFIVRSVFVLCCLVYSIHSYCLFYLSLY